VRQGLLAQEDAQTVITDLLGGMKIELSKAKLKAERISKLKDVIAIANMIPADKIAIDVTEALSEKVKLRTSDSSNEQFAFITHKYTVLCHYLQTLDFPQQFYDYIIQDAPEHSSGITPENVDGVKSALARYDTFLEYRKGLRQLIRMAKRNPSAWLRIAAAMLNDNLRVTTTEEVYIEEGLFRRRYNSFLYIIDGIEASRIRECAICNLIFYAERIDKKCCSARCTNVFNVRRLRERYAENPEAYKQKRAANERYKQKKGK
jgi:predicted nucleic acid-binding Zn ribbon protein